MRIIKRGNNDTRRMFECYNCKCVYEAYNGEYTIFPIDNYVKHYSNCPNCGEMISSLIPDNVADRIRELHTEAEITALLEKYHNCELDWDGNPI